MKVKSDTVPHIEMATRIGCPYHLAIFWCCKESTEYSPTYISCEDSLRTIDNYEPIFYWRYQDCFFKHVLEESQAVTLIACASYYAGISYYFQSETQDHFFKNPRSCAISLFHSHGFKFLSFPTFYTQSELALFVRKYGFHFQFAILFSICEYLYCYCFFHAPLNGYITYYSSWGFYNFWKRNTMLRLLRM